MWRWFVCITFILSVQSHLSYIFCYRINNNNNNKLPFSIHTIYWQMTWYYSCLSHYLGTYEKYYYLLHSEFRRIDLFCEINHYHTTTHPFEEDDDDDGDWFHKIKFIHWIVTFCQKWNTITGLFDPEMIRYDMRFIFFQYPLQRCAVQLVLPSKEWYCEILL